MKIGFTAEPAKQQIIITAVFDAHLEVIYATYTSSDLLPQWWGPENLTTNVEKMDIRPGGEYRFVQRDPEGREYAFHGFYHQVAPREHLAYTFEFEGMPGHIALETVTLEQQPNGKTKVTVSDIYQSVADRDAVLASGMQKGATESMERFARLVESS